MKIRPRSKKNRGFTLLEIMLVVAIIAMMLGAGFYYLGDSIGAARDMRVQSDIQVFDQRLKTYEAWNGFLPTTEQGLLALKEQPQSDPKPTRWHQFMDKIPQDPWNSEYVYVCPGVHNPNTYDLYSLGKDRKAGTADDVGNWDQGK